MASIKLETYPIFPNGVRAILWNKMVRYCVLESLDFSNHLTLLGVLDVIADFCLREHIKSCLINNYELQEIIDLCESTQDAIKCRLCSGDWC